MKLREVRTAGREYEERRQQLLTEREDAAEQYEYLILSQSDIAGWGSGKPDPIAIEFELNKLGRRGWHVVAMLSTGQVKQWLSIDLAHTTITLERKVR
jgi:Domain of unknown function (DUF4177)